MATREYFSHDYNARSDPKMVRLIMDHGMEGVGIYWCIVEMLYENGGYIDLSECERIAFELRTDCDRIATIVRSNLFRIADEKFYSETALERLEKRGEKSHKASASAHARWGNNSKDDANALRTQCNSNAIKVKEKKIKVKEIKVNTQERDPYFYLSEGMSPNQDLVRKWVHWVEFRKSMRKPYKTKEGEAAAYNRLLKLSESNSLVAIEIIDQSIANEWQGLFPLKNDAKPASSLKPKSEARRKYEAQLMQDNHE